MSKIFNSPLDIDGQEIDMNVSLGVSVYPDDADTSEGLIVKADSAMYYAKENKTCYKIYNQDDM